MNPNDDSYLLAIPSREQLRSLLSYMLDEDEFLSPYGIRSMSRYHEKHPYELDIDGIKYKVDYVPGESNTHMFGGNSNWRGPIWYCGKYNIKCRLRTLKDDRTGVLQHKLQYGAQQKIETENLFWVNASC